MHPLEKEVLALIRRENLLSVGEKVVVGVSGGPDSMALLHLLAGTKEIGVEPVAVYVDHGLRPDETKDEAALVEQKAASMGISFETVRVDVKSEARQRKISIEHAARDVRYSFFDQVAHKYKAAKIAVAHTADDQAEEVLLRLIRGSGRSGLSGMKMIRDGKIIRPLLAISKKKILAYLADRNIAFLTDSSNLQRIYLRNRIRLDLLPYLQEFNPNISETLRQTAGVLQDEERLLEEMTSRAWQGVAEMPELEANSVEPKVTLDLKAFLLLDRAIQRRIAEKSFILLGSMPQWKKIEQILYLAAHGESGARLHFSRGLRLKKIKESLVFSYPKGMVGERGDLEE